MPSLLDTIRSVFRVPGAATTAGADVATDARVLDLLRRGLSPRQHKLNGLWSWYTGNNYETRSFNWDGARCLSQWEADAVSSRGTAPTDYWPNEALPLRFRRPTAPYRLPTVIVDRFTGLLFSQRRHPNFTCAGNPDIADVANALADSTRLWMLAIQARQYGGATGSVALSFRFVEGAPRVEVHDPRWCKPTWKDREAQQLEALEKSYLYPEEELDPRTGSWRQVWYWYKRVIDTTSDTLYEPLRIDATDGKQADDLLFNADWRVQEVVKHGYGFCPAVWVQNLPMQNDIDGVPDCDGIFPLVEAMDALRAQSVRGTVANIDPTLVLRTDGAVDPGTRKGSGNALQLGAQDSATYLEIAGTGFTSAANERASLRSEALEVAQCVLDHPDVAAKTATEIERVYSSMLAKADVLREQYGQRGILPLWEMMLRAAVAHKKRGEVVNLPRKAVDPDGAGPQKMRLVERELPDVETDGGMLDLHWGGYFDPTPQEALTATQAASAAVAAKLIPRRAGTEYVAQQFHLDDAQAAYEAIEEEERAALAKLDEAAMLGSAQRNNPPPQRPGPLPIDAAQGEAPDVDDGADEDQPAPRGAVVAGAAE